MLRKCSEFAEEEHTEEMNVFCFLSVDLIKIDTWLILSQVSKLLHNTKQSKSIEVDHFCLVSTSTSRHPF